MTTRSRSCVTSCSRDSRDRRPIDLAGRGVSILTKMRSALRRVGWASFFLASALAATYATAQGWKPAGPVRFIVPIQGATVDILARLAAPLLQERGGQPVVVEAKPGAGGNIGTDLVAKSAPDGQTILVAFTSRITVNATLSDKMRYDPLKDLAPITLAVTTPQFFTVHPSVPANSVSEFIAYAKKNPGKLSYASVSIGSSSHLTMEMLKLAARVALSHAPY